MAAPAPTSSQAPATQGPMSQKKRKAMFEATQAVAGPSQQTQTQTRAPANQPLRPLTGVTRSQIEEDETEEVVSQEEESIDELYVMLKSNVVGVQYYKGE